MNVNLILLSAGFLQGLALSFAIWKKGQLRIASGLLIAFILVITLQILLKGLSKAWVVEEIPQFLVVLTYELPYLFGPLAYFYIKKSLKPEEAITLWDYLLLIPFAVMMCLLALFVFANAVWTVDYLPNNNFRLALAMLMQLAVLGLSHWRSSRLIKMYAGNEDQGGWLRDFLTATTTVGAIIIVALKAMYFFYPLLDEVRYLFLSLVVFLYWISYRVLSGAPSNGIPIVVSLKNVFAGVRYSRSSLKTEEAITIEQQLRILMDNDRVYLTQGLTMDELATRLQVRKHHLSQVLNEKLNMSFNDFVNSYRLAAAREMLINPRFNHLSVTGIGFECGFNSLSSFNMVFRKREGMPPSEFRKSALLGDRRTTGTNSQAR